MTLQADCTIFIMHWGQTEWSFRDMTIPCAMIVIYFLILIYFLAFRVCVTLLPGAAVGPTDMIFVTNRQAIYVMCSIECWLDL